MLTKEIIKNDIVELMNRSFEGDYFYIARERNNSYGTKLTLVYRKTDEDLIVLSSSIDIADESMEREFNSIIITNLLFAKETNNQCLKANGDTFHTLADIKRDILIFQGKNPKSELEELAIKSKYLYTELNVVNKKLANAQILSNEIMESFGFTLITTGDRLYLYRKELHKLIHYEVILDITLPNKLVVNELIKKEITSHEEIEINSVIDFREYLLSKEII
jgi:hypothetical protein